jgi:hypothetical protein
MVLGDDGIRRGLLSGRHDHCGLGVLCPRYDYSDTWQLVINTTTTIITFLMCSSFRTRRIETPRRFS